MEHVIRSVSLVVALVTVAVGAAADDFEVQRPDFLEPLQGQGGSTTSTTLVEYASNRVEDLNTSVTEEVGAAASDIASFARDIVAGTTSALAEASSIASLVRAAHDRARPDDPPLDAVRTNLGIARGPTGLADGTIALFEAIGEPLSVNQQLQVRNDASTVPSDIALAGSVLVFAMLDALDHLETAYENLDEAAWTAVNASGILLDLLPRRLSFATVDGNSTLKLPTNTTRAWSAASNLSASIHTTDLFKAGLVLADALDEVEGLEIPTPPMEPPLELGNCGEGLAWFVSPLCLVIIGASSENEYGGTGMFTDSQRSFDSNMLLIDLGGNDTYRHRAGGGYGDYEAVFNGCIKCGVGLQVLADLGAGEDAYTGPAAHYRGGAAQGAGRLGAGVLFDGGGNDSYTASNRNTDRGIVAQGSGDSGFGMLYDKGGDDHYIVVQRGTHAPSRAQGAAQEGGVGLLFDEAGADTYRFELQPPLGGSRVDGGGAQGFARMAGIAYLVDRGDSGDAYEAGQDLVQGAATTSALAYLIDLGGTNSFTVNATDGCPFWVDSACGFDSTPVALGGWGQGFAAIDAFAALVGGPGDDLYTTRVADSEADLSFVGRRLLGAGNFTGAAVLYEPAGNDTYRIAHEPALYGAEAIGFAMQGVAVFIDEGGFDAYWCVAPTCFGYAEGGVAVYYDEGPGNWYADGAPRSDPWTKGSIGLGVQQVEGAT